MKRTKISVEDFIHELCLQEVQKSTPSVFVEKRCHINEIESIPWDAG